MKRKTLGYLSAIAVSVLWGISFIGSKKAMAGGLDTFSLVSVRFVVSTAVLYILAKLFKMSLRLHKRDFVPMLLTALTGITIYYYCELQGIEHTGASVSSLIISTIPVFSMLTGVIFHKKKTNLLTWLGVAMSVAGVYLMAFNDAGSNTFGGILYLFGACACWIIYLELTDKLLGSYRWLHVTFWQSLLGLLTTIPLALSEKVTWSSISADVWIWSAVFLGLICSGACFLMNNYSIATIKPQMNAMFLNLSPVATAAAGYLLLGERISLKQAVGGVVIIASLFLISYAERKTGNK